MGRVLFSGDDAKKKLGSLSGGEAARLVFCRIAIERPNVLVLDEPTNHLDLESIEALVESLRSYEGTLVLVSHDRWFVSQLATRIVEITAEGVNDYKGTYSDYVHHCGDDHLDVDAVVLRAKTEKQAARAAREDGPPKSPKKDFGKRRWKGQKLAARRDAITARIDQAEARVSEIDMLFCEPAFYDTTAADEVRRLESERATLQGELGDHVREWEEIEEALEALD